MDLLRNEVFLLLVILVAGDLLGRVRIFSVSLGPSAIIFVALLSGHFGVRLPSALRILGLLFFIYSVGLQAGPGFLSSFRRHGLALTGGALLLIFSGFLLSFLLALYFGFSGATAAGLFAGAFTSTPGLAVLSQLPGSHDAASAYGVAYLFGVVGVILFVKIAPLLFRTKVENEERRLRREEERNRPRVDFIHLEVNNPSLFEKRVKEIYLPNFAAVTITRLLRPGAAEPILVDGETILQEKDHLRVIGEEEELKKAELLFGKRVEGEMEFNSRLIKREVVVSRPQVMGHTVASLDFRHLFNVQVSRITRNEIDLAVTPELRLNRGDLLHLVGQEEGIRNAAKVVGNDLKSTFTAHLSAILGGILLGLLIGEIPLYIPFVGTFKPGLTGGVLISGLLLGHFKKTGPILWDIPATTNSFIREMGLYLFLASVGTSAGSTVMETLQTQGLALFASGMVVTLLPPLLFTAMARLIWKINFMEILGIVTGGMTSTPGLAAAESTTKSEHISTFYATVYPVAMVAMILFARLLVLIL